MTQDISRNQRTSADQIRGTAKLIRNLLLGLGRHVKRFGLFYGFLTGVAATLAMFWAVFVFGILAYPLPWKVIDPTDPRFNPAAFRFTDYASKRTLGPALQALFPVGTEREKIDQFLTAAGAQIEPLRPTERRPNPPNLVYYNYWHFRGALYDILYLTPAGDNAWRVGIYYDDNNRVEKIVGISP